LESVLHANNRYLPTLICMSIRSPQPLRFLSEAKAKGYITIRPDTGPSFNIPITLRVCSNDPMLRFFLRQGPSSTEWCCIYCFWLRHFPSPQLSQPLRSDVVHRQVSQLGLGGYPNPSRT